MKQTASVIKLVSPFVSTNDISCSRSSATSERLYSLTCLSVKANSHAVRSQDTSHHYKFNLDRNKVCFVP